MNDQGKYFLSCDWGTTSLRVRLVEANGLRIVAEEASKQGIADVAKSWKESSGSEDRRAAFYLAIVQEHIEKMKAASGKDLAGIPLVVSGMASSTLGIREVAYGRLPFALDGSDLKTETIPQSDDFPHPAMIISGVKSDDDVMRGEEVQVVGCEADARPEEQMIIHPGTHSKHIVLKDGKAVSFRTFMSGEVFSLACKKSILSGSVKENEDFDNAANRGAFEDGVRAGAHGALLHELFLVRTGDLFKKRSPEANFHYLSGVVIGSELKAFPNGFNGPLILAGEQVLVKQYDAALSTLGIKDRVSEFSTKDAVAITLAGQYEVYRRQQH